MGEERLREKQSRSSGLTESSESELLRQKNLDVVYSGPGKSEERIQKLLSHWAKDLNNVTGSKRKLRSVLRKRDAVVDAAG